MPSRILDKAPRYTIPALLATFTLLAGTVLFVLNWNMYTQNTSLEKSVTEMTTQNTQADENLENLKSKMNSSQVREDQLDGQLDSTEGFLP